MLVVFCVAVSFLGASILFILSISLQNCLNLQECSIGSFGFLFFDIVVFFWYTNLRYRPGQSFVVRGVYRAPTDVRVLPL